MKKLRQFSHKSVSPAWGRLLYTLFLVMTLSMVFVQPAFAADTIWSKASEIMQDVYNQILHISTIAAIVPRFPTLIVCDRFSCAVAHELFPQRPHCRREPGLAQENYYNLGNSEQPGFHHVVCRPLL